MWNGMFSPNLRKGIGTVRYVPLSAMTPRDWEWLDYENIRTVAQNRIASAIIRGRLYGFFQVMITEKAAKNEYFWPATPGEIQQFVDTGDHDFFRYRPEVENITDANQAVERLRLSMFGVSVPVLAMIVRAIRLYIAQELQEQTEQVDENHLAELDEDAREILMAAIMMWYFSLEEAQALLDDLPGSDEFDEVQDWINDRVDELESARRQIAAGRGLTHS